MKQTILSLAVLALSGQAVAQADIEINLKDKATDSICVEISDEALHPNATRMTIAAKKGKATLHLDAATVREVNIKAVPGEEGKEFRFVYIPGVNSKISGSWAEPNISGHIFYDDGQQFQASVKSVQERENTFMREANQKDLSEERTNELRKEFRDIWKEFASKTEGFISSHPNSDYSMYLALRPWMNQKRDEQIAKLTPEVQNGFMKPALDAMKAEEQKRAEEAERREKERQEQLAKLEGSDAPELALPTFDGTTLSLKSLQGKVVVVDFWGKWCYWCMKGMPDMKKYYEKYQGKMEILGVNYGDTDEVWRQTTQEENLSWKHVKMEKSQRQILSDFGVAGFPTKVVVSAEGKILKIVVGEDPGFYTYLDTLLGQE